MHAQREQKTKMRDRHIVTACRNGVAMCWVGKGAPGQLMATEYGARPIEADAVFWDGVMEPDSAGTQGVPKCGHQGLAK